MTDFSTYPWDQDDLAAFEPAVHPQIPPGLAAVDPDLVGEPYSPPGETATEKVVADRLYTPPERCQTKKHPPLGAPGRGLGLPTDPAARKRLQMWTYHIEYFPDTFLAVLEVAIVGNEQHNPGQLLHWAREKSTDQMNTAARHMWDHSRGVRKDTDGCYHLAKAIWRLSAELQLTIEAERSAGEAK